MVGGFKPLVENGLKFAFTAQTTHMRKIVVLLIGCFVSIHSFAQFHAGIFGGIANYHGDLVEKVYQTPKPAFGVSLAYQVNSRINLRTALSFARVAGADSLSESEDLQMRNLSFQSSIIELSFAGEFHTFDLDLKGWSPYVFAGLSVFKFNPYTFDRNGNKVFLQSLSTEGQGLPGYQNSKPYSLVQMAIPFGGGIRFNLSDNVRLGLEVGMRKLFTDYLDDVSGNYADPNDLLVQKGPLALELSYRGDEIPGGDPAYPPKGEQRGSPRYKDYYYFSGIQVLFRLPEGRSGDRAARKSGYGCPTVF
jgi:hypothetical protein